MSGSLVGPSSKEADVLDAQLRREGTEVLSKSFMRDMTPGSPTRQVAQAEYESVLLATFGGDSLDFDGLLGECVLLKSEHDVLRAQATTMRIAREVKEKEYDELVDLYDRNKALVDQQHKSYVELNHRHKLLQERFTAVEQDGFDLADKHEDLERQHAEMKRKFALITVTDEDLRDEKVAEESHLKHKLKEASARAASAEEQLASAIEQLSTARLELSECSRLREEHSFLSSEGLVPVRQQVSVLKSVLIASLQQMHDETKIILRERHKVHSEVYGLSFSDAMEHHSQDQAMVMGHYNSMKHELSTTIASLQLAEGHCDNLKGIVDETASRLREAEVECGRLNFQNSQLMQELDVNADAVASVEATLDDIDQQHNQSVHDLEQRLEKMMSDLDNEKKEKHNVSLTADDYKSDRDELRNKVRDSEAACIRLENDRDDLRQRFDDACGKINALKSMLANKADEAQALITMNEQLQRLSEERVARHHELKARADELSNEVTLAKAETQQARNEHADTADDLKRQLEIKDERVAATQREKDAHKRESERHRGDLLHLKQMHDNLRHEHKTLLDKHLWASSEAKKLDNKHSDLSSAHGAKVAEVDRLYSDLSNLKQEKVALGNDHDLLRLAHERTNSELAAAQADYSRLKAEHAEHVRIHEELKAQHYTVTDMHRMKESDFARLLEDYEALSAEHDARVRAHEELEGNHVTAKDLAKMKEGELKALFDDYETLKAEHDMRAKELASVKANHLAGMDAHNMTNVELAQLRAEHDQLQQEHDDRVRAHNELEAQHLSVTRLHDMKDEGLAKLLEDYEALKAEHDARIRAHTELEREHVSVKDLHAMTDDKLAKVLEDYETFKAEHDEHVRVHEELQGKHLSVNHLRALQDSELAKVLEDYEALKVEHDERVRAHKALESEHVSALDLHAMKDREVEKLLEDYEALKTEHSAHERDLAHLRREHLSVQSVHAMKDADLSSLLADYAALKREHEEQGRAHDTLRREHVSVSDMHAMKAGDLAQVLADYEVLKAEHDELTRRLEVHSSAKDMTRAQLEQDYDALKAEHDARKRILDDLKADPELDSTSARSSVHLQQVLREYAELKVEHEQLLGMDGNASALEILKDTNYLLMEMYISMRFTQGLALQKGQRNPSIFRRFQNAMPEVYEDEEKRQKAVERLRLIMDDLKLAQEWVTYDEIVQENKELKRQHGALLSELDQLNDHSSSMEHQLRSHEQLLRSTEHRDSIDLEREIAELKNDKNNLLAALDASEALNLELEEELQTCRAEVEANAKELQIAATLVLEEHNVSTPVATNRPLRTFAVEAASPEVFVTPDVSARAPDTSTVGPNSSTQADIAREVNELKKELVMAEQQLKKEMEKHSELRTQFEIVLAIHVAGRYEQGRLSDDQWNQVRSIEREVRQLYEDDKD